MTPSTRKAIILIAFFSAMGAGIASEFAVREIADTPAGFIPLAVMITTFVITAAVLTMLANAVKRNNP